MENRESSKGKFKVGDRVSLNNRCPQYIDLSRGHPRTIRSIDYDFTKQCNFYLLGSNGRGACAGEPPKDGYSCYLFRSYQLLPWHITGVVGRPRKKRAYRKRSNGLYHLSINNKQFEHH